MADAEGAQLGLDEIEAELTDVQNPTFTQKVPLNHLIEVLDVLWQNEGTL